MSCVNLRGIVRAAMAGALCFSFAAVAQASFFNLGPAGDFNVFVFGDNNQTSSDAEGRVAVGGNVNFGSGYTVAALAPSNNYNLIVGGNLTTQSNSLNGGLWVGGNVSWSNPSINGPVSVQGKPTSWAAAAASPGRSTSWAPTARQAISRRTALRR